MSSVYNKDDIIRPEQEQDEKGECVIDAVSQMT